MNSNRSKFDALFEEWEAETKFSPNLPTMTWHPNFRLIVEMGEVVAPFLYEKLVADRCVLGVGAMLWEIFQEGPNATHIAGNIEKLRGLWLDWLEKRLYLESE